MPRNKPTKHNSVPSVDSERPAISVTPLNSIPYPSTSSGKKKKNKGPAVMSNDKPSPAKRNKASGPAMVFLPSRPAEKDTKDILSASKGGVVLAGSAALAKVGPLIGSLDIGESMDGYLFRVSLPGVSTDTSTFSCEIEPSGKVVIKGVTVATGERVVHKHSQVFEMQTQNFCPPGEFSVTFTLPGPVTFADYTFQDGILVGKITKGAN